MFTFKQKLLLAFGISCMIVSLTSAIRCNPTPTTVEVIKEVKVPTEPKGVIVTVTIEDLYNDLSSRHSHISTTNKQLLMEAIAKSADKYNISPLVLYSLIAVESSFRWWIEHPTVTVQDSATKKPVKTRAIGLGGVVYEIWGQELKSKKIIETKADLFSISHNIESIAYIYSKLKSQPLHPKASNQIESGLIRYFGGGYVSYFNKIDKEIARIIKGKVYK
jgi:hypothetical protein